MDAEPDDQPLFGAVAARLTELQPDPRRAGALRARLFDRVQRSVVAHREYQTVRVADRPWQQLSAGVARRVLRSDARTRVEIQCLAPGATLDLPEDADAQEILVLEGALSSPQSTAAPSGVPGARAYGVRQRMLSDAPVVALEASTVYLRHRLGEGAPLPALEARWWNAALASSAWVDPGRRRWHATGEGVEVLSLRGDSEVVSMLVRFAAGASVPDHRHALDEDCLVLQGEMFLGDILLRTGDYQLAPAGGSHFGETSDVGVLFFFHGALDPVLRGETAPKS